MKTWTSGILSFKELLRIEKSLKRLLWRLLICRSWLQLTLTLKMLMLWLKRVRSLMSQKEESQGRAIMLLIMLILSISETLASFNTYSKWGKTKELRQKNNSASKWIWEITKGMMILSKLNSHGSTLLLKHIKAATCISMRAQEPTQPT